MAQFGATVWLNGKKVGEHLPCFSAAVFEISGVIRWNAENELVIRVGAHPGVLPDPTSAGTDFEKLRWTPGIYDSVTLALSDNPSISTIQVAPRLADSSITVQTVFKNYSDLPVSTLLRHQIHPWKSNEQVAESEALTVQLSPRQEKTVTQTIKIPHAKLWSPEDPNLYILETKTRGDSTITRFGMRELRFDTATQRAYLNGGVYFLRGSNITLHRFFEDPKSGTLPWNETWVRKLLVEIPKQMHWNTFRFCIGPVPQRWLDIADEAGLLIQYEYMVWTGHYWHGVENQVHYDAEQMKREYAEWMRDSWNHPSVVIWDANNETWDSIFGEQVIPAIRQLDLSGRPWENSYNPPVGPDDPIEDHPYEYQEMAGGGPEFLMSIFERPAERAPGVRTAHAMINNEYGWLWLNRDGSPTELTKQLYPRLLGNNDNPGGRLELNAYLLGGLTEYWRAYRRYAGVLHFVYLTSCEPGGYTCDNFRDVENLELHSEFRDYMNNAFNPLGVYLSFWQPTIKAKQSLSVPVMLVNDESSPTGGALTLALMTSDGKGMFRKELEFSVAAGGQSTYYYDVTVPDTVGEFWLTATAATESKKVLSRRRVSITQQTTK
jgi:hypothetical protein